MNKQRLLSLDIMRGLTIIGMILVNSAYDGVFNQNGVAAAPDFLFHADWNGASFADLVLPFFILMVGVSIPFALSSAKKEGGLTKKLLARFCKRSALLFIIGMGLTFYYFSFEGEKLFRIFGALQRIGLAFLGASIIFMLTGLRTQIILIVAILLGYWGLLYAPFPDGDVNLLVPGQNFVHWFDRAILGGHLYVDKGPFPYDPEGILSTIPAIAQVLIGAVIGSYLKAHKDYLKVFGACVMMVGAALIWDIYMPMNKALWNGSFVLYSSGLGGVLLMTLVYIIDVKGFKRGLKPVEAYGINALFSYVLHYLTTGYLLATPLGVGVFTYLSGIISPAGAMLSVMLIILTVTWIPLAILQAKKIIIKV